MKFIPDTAHYPENEIDKLHALESLFVAWHQHFLCCRSRLSKHSADDMVCDGFYPYYFEQPRRILFIGREARDISGFNYIELLYSAYKKTKMIGTQALNASRFHSRMFYLTYGIMNNFPEWRDIPYASVIADTFAESGGLSFAFMNISKFSNDGSNWQSDWDVINVSHDVSASGAGRNFLQEEIALLEPHVVVTMNLGAKIESLGSLSPISDGSLPRAFWLDTIGNRSLLVDAWHFSAPRKRDIPDYYEPIKGMVTKNLK